MSSEPSRTDAHPQLLLRPLKAGEPASADGTLLEMVLLRGAKQQVLPTPSFFFFSQILLRLNRLSSVKRTWLLSKGKRSLG